MGATSKTSYTTVLGEKLRQTVKCGSLDLTLLLMEQWLMGTESWRWHSVPVTSVT